LRTLDLLESKVNGVGAKALRHKTCRLFVAPGQVTSHKETKYRRISESGREIFSLKDPVLPLDQVQSHRFREDSMKCITKGFGLLELVIVLGLIAIIAASAVPGMHRINQEWALWGGARLLESSLLWARTHAIAANDSLALMIDNGGARFYWQDPTGARYQSSIRLLPAGVRITQAPRRPVCFFPRGNAVPAGTFVVQGATGSYRVVVSALGRIRVQRN
jgi:prepilin-type N-terminal cleavage/methylation domain-containing protein